MSRDDQKASVDKTLPRLKRITQGPDLEVSERDMLWVLKDHFHRIGHDEIAEQITDFLIGYTEEAPSAAA